MANEKEGNENVRPFGGPRSQRKSACSSSSMLLSPQNSVVIVVDPLKSIVSGFDPSISKELEAKTSALIETATSLNIAVIVSALGVDGDAAELIEGTSSENDGCQVMWRETVSPWDGSALLSQLECYSHPALVIAGVAGTPSVVLTILGALQEGYDVHFPTDICVDASRGIDAGTFLLRLAQAGAVPTTLNQVLAEWACDDPKSVCRAVLADSIQKPNLQTEFWHLLDGLNK